MNSPVLIDSPQCWPALPYAAWQPTCETLHMWTQIVGKVRLALTPPVNHFWNVPLYVSSRGLTTSAIPYRGSAFELEFDFNCHNLVLHMADGQELTLPLHAQPVAEFYRRFLEMLRAAGIEVHIWKMPVEVPNPIPFDEDFTHASYDPRCCPPILANPRFRRTQSSTSSARASSENAVPVHFFWGSFDLAVTRFSGRRAPERPGADAITREAYSHEVSSVGFWPGAGLGNPAFYSYAAPEPDGFSSAAVRPPRPTMTPISRSSSSCTTMRAAHHPHRRRCSISASPPTMRRQR